MADEGKLRQQQEKGERASQLLENQTLQEAFQDIEDMLMNAWKESDPHDHERREDAWRSYKLMQKIKEQIKQYETQGKVANKELIQIKGQSKVKRWMGNV